MSAASTTEPASADQMLKAIRALVPPGAVVEMRIPEYGGRKTNTASGYFDDLEKFVTVARAHDGKAAGLYFTMNPVKPELLARRVNRSEQYVKLTTADHDIERRHWVLIDIDPIRPAGICSTDAEHDAAHAKATEITDHLARLGFPEPVRMDSGNGAYLLYPVDLPNDDASRDLIQSFLNALGERFNDHVIKIDTSVYNAARIMRVPGTQNAKGDSTPDRPHRRARLLSVHRNLVTVEPELLASVIQLKSEPDPTTTTNRQAPPTSAQTDVTADIEWMQEWLKAHELETRHDESWKGTGHRWSLEVCPFNPDHDRGEAWVCILPTGARAAGCRHDSCTWKWSDLRAKVEPSDDGQLEADVLPAPGDPMGVARILIQDHQDDNGELTLRHWRGGPMQWLGTHWAEIEDKAIKAWVYSRLENAQYWHLQPATTTREEIRELKPWNPNRHKVANVVEALTAITHTPETIDPPSWLGLVRDGPRPNPLLAQLNTGGVVRGGPHNPSNYRASEIVACTNGLLHVGTRKLLDLTPLYFNRVAVPFEYEPAAAEPTRWLRFLNQLWLEDSESIATLQEFFGYVLSGRTDLHKIMLLIGPTRSGKGTIARVLAALLGKGNVAGPTLASLGTNFGLSPLLGKPLALVSDARLAGGNVHQVVERLLSISGEDHLTVDRKYREPWTGKLPSRFLILSNELPRFGDASGAIANRFVVLAMHRSFLGEENTHLTEELTAEFAGILSWSLDGLDRLTGQGKFTEPKSSTDSILALQDLVSPVAAFVRDRCEVGIGNDIVIADLFAEWKTWCEDNGHKPGSVQSFGRDLRAVVPHLRVARPRDGESNRERRYAGVKLRETTPTNNGDDRGPSRTNPENEAPGAEKTEEPPTSGEWVNVPHCNRCDRPLLAPHSQQRGICESCWLHDKDTP